MTKLPTSYIDDPKSRTFIYIFECGSFIKVGMTRSLKRRQEEIEAHNPYEVRLAYHRGISTAVARKTEKALHEALKSFRHRGEWFSLSSREALPHLQRIARAALNEEQRMATIRRREGWGPGGELYPNAAQLAEITKVNTDAALP